jgi:double zinc ribbon protein
MDGLDRMFRRLVHNVRAGFPDLLSRPFEISALHQHLVPYRLNRGELAIDSAEEYELTLMRLLSGDRGMITGDPEMQAALRSELESTNPDLSAFRAWGTSTVSITSAALRALDGQAAMPMRSVSAGAPTRQAEMAGRATLELPASGGVPAASATQVATPPSHVVTSPVVAGAPVMPQAHATGCRYCGGELPEGREVHFCPHCGQNLTVRQCPACSTELEVEWQFCITCGRQAE